MKKKNITSISYILAAILLVAALVFCQCTADEKVDVTMCIRDYVEVLC